MILHRPAPSATRIEISRMRLIGARQLQIRDIGAGNQQHESHCPEHGDKDDPDFALIAGEDIRCNR